EKRAFEFLGGEIAPAIVHRRELAAIDRYELTTKQIKIFAQQGKGATDVAQWLQIILAKVGNRLEIGSEFFEQPNYLKIADRLAFQQAAGTYAIEITIHIQ